jgi:hypothetical protein
VNLEDAADRRASLAVPCSHCHAETGQVCTRPDGRGGRVELENVAAHTPRLADAGVIHAPIPSRDLRGA